MTRYARQVDANQAAVVDALRRVGALVQHLHTVGGGCPDLLVGFRGKLLLLEVKDGRKPPSERRLNDAEAEWHRRWAGYPVATVTSPLDALKAIGVDT
jgi:hypothetical protein